jgi:hypothetical protein
MLLLGLTFLHGCAGPSVSLSSSPETLAALASKQVTVVDWTAPDAKLFGFPKVDHVFDPLVRRCELGGGTAVTQREVFIFKPERPELGKSAPGPWHAIQHALPSALTCMPPNGDLEKDGWAVDISYRHKFKWLMTDDNKLMDLWIKASFVTGSQLAERIKLAQTKSDYEKARQADLLQAARSQDQDMAAYLRRKEAARQAAAPTFRNQLKVGDKTRLQDGGPQSTGLVVEIKRPLALVQFDQLLVNGESRRWIRIDELEPSQ